jgi:cyclopropane fatty-acyl-phospholipid synthase-like methyltransferase
MDDPKRLVAAGYDAMAARFDEWQKEVSGSPRMRYLEQLLELLPGRPDVLELGCGAAVESTRILAERANFTGVDISEAQIAVARKRLPQATFIPADLSTLAFAPESFDAVVAFYVLLHIPRAELDPLLGRVASWLRPGGLFLANTLVRGEGEAVEQWLGVPMFFSGSDPASDRARIADAGLARIQDEVVTQQEPEGELAFHWLLAQKPRT